MAPIIPSMSAMPARCFFFWGGGSMWCVCVGLLRGLGVPSVRLLHAPSAISTQSNASSRSEAFDLRYETKHHHKWYQTSQPTTCLAHLLPRPTDATTSYGCRKKTPKHHHKWDQTSQPTTGLSHLPCPTDVTKHHKALTWSILNCCFTLSSPEALSRFSTVMPASYVYLRASNGREGV